MTPVLEVTQLPDGTTQPVTYHLLIAWASNPDGATIEFQGFPEEVNLVLERREVGSKPAYYGVWHQVTVDPSIQREIIQGQVIVTVDGEEHILPLVLDVAPGCECRPIA